MGVFDPRGRGIMEALIALLRQLNVSFGVLRKEKCTGDAARRLGNDLLFSELAHFNIDQLRAAKVQRMLSTCPHCVRTIGEDWREFGFTVSIEHHSEFLARHLGKASPADSRRVVFHDPCYLGRYRGTYRPPREVAAQGGALIEAPRHGRRSFCCGAGGGLMFLGEEKGERVSAVRAQELASTGAGVIATACPFCQSMFRDALSGKPDAPRVLDIAELAGGTRT
jgi:Fe-S oxidoreductase